MRELVRDKGQLEDIAPKSYGLRKRKHSGVKTQVEKCLSDIDWDRYNKDYGRVI